MLHMIVIDMKRVGNKQTMKELVKRRFPLVTRFVRWLYDLQNAYRSRPAYYVPRAPFLASYRFDRVFFDGRGDHPTQHLARTKRIIPVKGADVLVVGCRWGNEVDLWLDECPRSLVALDYFAYTQEWNEAISRYSPQRLDFLSADARKLPFADERFDIVSSYRLLEHVNPAAESIGEMYRVLRQGGVVFAGFLPLFWTYGGAHFEGAFEHLLFSTQKFYRWIVERDRPVEQAECRHYLDHNMFSYWTLDQYLSSFRNFERLYAIVHLSSGAYGYRQSHPKEWKILTAKVAEKDLLVSGLTIWLRKPIGTQ